MEVHHVIQALESASEAFEQGCVGAGRGTVCCGLKGGIGSSSRVLDFAGKTYTLGALVQSNFGRMEDLRSAGWKQNRAGTAPEELKGRRIDYDYNRY